MNISYTVLSRQSTMIGTFEDLFRLFLSVVVGLFLFGNGDEQKAFGNGDILDELDDEVEGVDEFPYGGEARQAEQADVFKPGEWTGKDVTSDVFRDDEGCW